MAHLAGLTPNILRYANNKFMENLCTLLGYIPPHTTDYLLIEINDTLNSLKKLLILEGVSPEYNFMSSVVNLSNDLNTIKQVCPELDVEVNLLDMKLKELVKCYQSEILIYSDDSIETQLQDITTELLNNSTTKDDVLQGLNVFLNNLYNFLEKGKATLAPGIPAPYCLNGTIKQCVNEKSVDLLGKLMLLISSTISGTTKEGLKRLSERFIDIYSINSKQINAVLAELETIYPLSEHMKKALANNVQDLKITILSCLFINCLYQFYIENSQTNIGMVDIPVEIWDSAQATELRESPDRFVLFGEDILDENTPENVKNTLYFWWMKYATYLPDCQTRGLLIEITDKNNYSLADFVKFGLEVEIDLINFSHEHPEQPLQISDSHLEDLTSFLLIKLESTQYGKVYEYNYSKTRLKPSEVCLDDFHLKKLAVESAISTLLGALSTSDLLVTNQELMQAYTNLTYFRENDFASDYEDRLVETLELPNEIERWQMCSSLLLQYRHYFYNGYFALSAIKKSLENVKLNFKLHSDALADIKFRGINLSDFMKINAKEFADIKKASVTEYVLVDGSTSKKAPTTEIDTVATLSNIEDYLNDVRNVVKVLKGRLDLRISLNADNRTSKEFKEALNEYKSFVEAGIAKEQAESTPIFTGILKHYGFKEINVSASHYTENIKSIAPIKIGKQTNQQITESFLENFKKWLLVLESRYFFVANCSSLEDLVTPKL